MFQSTMEIRNNTQIIIRTGPLNSLRSLHYNVSPQLKQLRDLYAIGQTPNVCWDLSDVGYRTTNMATITAFLSNAKRLKDFIGQPIPVIMNWDPNLLSFLADIDFLDIADKFQIFKWQEGMIGGFQRGKHNPRTKILYFGDVLKEEFEDIDELNEYKAFLKQKISPNLLLRTANLFENLDTKLKLTVANTTLELVANSLIHGLSTCFVGLQRSSNRITVSVCDTGIGFRRSLKKYFLKTERNLTHAQAIAIGSLIQKDNHGLRLAIEEVLGFNEYLLDDVNQGWVVISSYDAEIRWQKKNWERAYKLFDMIDLNIDVPTESDLLGEINYDSDQHNGYWRKYNSSLIGTRITFEIYINKR